MPTYVVNDQEIHTVKEGSPNRQKAILIHGWSSSSYAMSPLTGLLSQRFSCVAVDLPGYGKSPPLSGPISIPTYADLLVDLIEQISDGPVVLVGHSMGGMISLAIAQRHPAIVERMVLLCPTITGRLSTMINVLISPINMIERFGIGQLLVSTVEKLYVGLTDRLMRPVSFADRTGITEAEYNRLREDARRPGQGRTRAECFFAMRESDLSGTFGGVEAPALVIWGAEDNTVPLRDAGVVADEWPDANLRIIPKAGHWPHFETPVITRRLVASYLGLPLLSDKLHSPVDDEEMASVQETARFLAHSGIANNLNLAQRIRLAAQLRQRTYPPLRHLFDITNDNDPEMYIVRDGTVEVWSDPDSPGELPRQPRKAATVRPGDVVGEFAMLDQGLRTANLIAGPEGATVLALDRERLLALMEDDPELGSRLLWNIANVMSQRARFILWQLRRAQQRAKAKQQLWEQEREQHVGRVLQESLARSPTGS
jgi:pimeloyl-ACP methyl ester carboxylesterase/CRP-like cAMP-binding protein